MVYRLDEQAVRDGVLVGETFFRGAPLPGDDEGRRAAIFAVPRGLEADPKIRVIAEDAAGNRASRSWATRLKDSPCPCPGILMRLLPRSCPKPRSGRRGKTSAPMVLQTSK